MYKHDFFDRDRFLAFMRTLKDEGAVENLVRVIPDKVAVMTHDDEFDTEMYEWEKACGYQSTWFMLKVKQALPDEPIDFQLHYEMERPEHIGGQIAEFERAVGEKPLANRNHRAFCRAPHLDLANMAMHGIKVDSTFQGGHSPFRLCIQGRLLPIWEVPFQVADVGFVDAMQYCHPVYNVARMEHLFASGKTPVVGLFHPYLKAHTNWKGFFELAELHGYKVMTMSQLYATYLC